jgi:hypothetical protein
MFIALPEHRQRGIALAVFSSLSPAAALYMGFSRSPLP